MKNCPQPLSKEERIEDARKSFELFKNVLIDSIDLESKTLWADVESIIWVAYLAGRKEL